MWTLTIKNTASGLDGSEQISLTAPNFNGFAIPYNSPSIFAPFVIGDHTNIVNEVGCSFNFVVHNLLDLSVHGMYCFELAFLFDGDVMTENVRCSVP